MLLIDCDNIQNSEELLIEEFDWNIIQSTKIRSSFDETDNKETYYQSNENNKVLFVQQPSDLINITSNEAMPKADTMIFSNAVQ